MFEVSERSVLIDGERRGFSCVLIGFSFGYGVGLGSATDGEMDDGAAAVVGSRQFLVDGFGITSFLCVFEQIDFRCFAGPIAGDGRLRDDW